MALMPRRSRSRVPGAARQLVVIAGAVLVLALSVACTPTEPAEGALLTATGVDQRPVAVVEQRRQVFVGHQNYPSPVSPIPSVRSAARHKTLSPETHTTGSAGPALDEDFDWVNKHLQTRCAPEAE